MHIATRRIYVEEGTRLFEYEGRKCHGTRWGTWVIRVDGGFRPELCDMGAYDAVIQPRWRPQKTVKVEEAVARTVVKVPNPKVPGGTQTSEPPRVLELFSGTGYVGQVFADEVMRWFQ